MFVFREELEEHCNPLGPLGSYSSLRLENKGQCIFKELSPSVPHAHSEQLQQQFLDGISSGCEAQSTRQLNTARKKSRGMRITPESLKLAPGRVMLDALVADQTWTEWLHSLRVEPVSSELPMNALKSSLNTIEESREVFRSELAKETLKQQSIGIMDPLELARAELVSFILYNHNFCNLLFIYSVR